MAIKIGVLALQGDVAEHIHAFEDAITESGLFKDYNVFALKKAEEIPSCDAIAIPGGESTTISRLIDKNHMREEFESFSGGIFATCAGMVLCAGSVDDDRLKPLSLIDIKVGRNAFGRQKDSFEAEIEIKGYKEPYRAIFIRAPVVESAGAGVEILAEIDQGIVAVRSGKHMAISFHPELTGDFRLHIDFIKNLKLTEE
ncbi:pyridoxal 5'-phosphate synthase glutaminase subunit PdxT [Methanoplanus endosymbiosus]|uniref:Pyridoxal 5'-phosphate synthase subunit PdxT n=1 Tax=Methanoplanus endosymbiosus TaxID=33865 RepID=A0A9E7PK03_9EURY|nr:pyridoxal 5'-phosphate synthase glutaminase subunit PdxT [Methanoplanus endosymbiosus]UUX91308.1 pyridoxal 5'-phosphate synthase glutaminase subunit PdxT [Methanoplanus endosymbiosus]